MNHNYFCESDGLRFILETRQLLGVSKQFPKDRNNYAEILYTIEEWLRINLYPEIVQSAANHGDGLLNDHGADHVNMVIHCAELILNEKVNQLVGYEIFILILSILFHDVGNIYGREDHETRILEIIDSSKLQLILDDQPVFMFVANIASSHSGVVMGNSDKDTIRDLNERTHLNGIEIRPALIASILRYSDEIADDKTRAARFNYYANNIPPKSRIFHDYSKSLQQVAISGDTLVLKYDLSYKLATEMTTKADVNGDDGFINKYLYDEILERLKKNFCELEYCRKYSLGFIGITKISADISVLQPKINKFKLIDSIRLRISGYPNTQCSTIDTLCIKPLAVKTGEELKKLVEDS